MVEANWFEDIEAFCRRLHSDLSVLFCHDQPILVARAPARLELMGGLAEQTGSLVLQTTLDRAVVLACQPRHDQSVVVHSLLCCEPHSPGRCQWPLSALYAGHDRLTRPEQFVGYFDTVGCAWAKYVASLFYALLEAGHLPHFAGGVSIVFDSHIPARAGLGASAAIQVATIQGLCGLFELPLDALARARLCQRAENITLGRPAGIADHLTSLLGQPDNLVQLRCQPHQVVGSLPLPQGVRAIGIDSGLRQPAGRQRTFDSYTAACMGHHIITGQTCQTDSASEPVGGCLANISPAQFVDRFRDLLPARIYGHEFLQRYGQLRCPQLTIVPDRIYKVRSRSEHHIYENRRVHQFVSCIARANRTGRDEPLVEAGRVMYASHWSYGQRCGLGTVQTDLLVKHIRDCGPDEGFYGARLTAGGLGGTVAVLLRDQEQTYQRLEQVLKFYYEKTGLQPQCFIGSSPGTEAFGFRRLQWQAPAPHSA
ncbi:MAG: galactokinase [Phycisphaerae bacterium]